MAFDFTDPNAALLLNLGGGLLAAGGPSSRPTNLGQAFGAAMPGAMQAQFQAEEANRQRQAQSLALMEHLQKRELAKKRQQALEQYGAGIADPQEQMRFGIDPEGYLKHLDEQGKPQVVGEGASVYQGGKAVFTAPKQEKPDEFASALTAAGIEPGSPQWNTAMNNRVTKLSTHAPAASATVVNKQETEEAKAYGKAAGEEYGNIQKSAFSAPSRISKLQRMENILSQIETGKAVPIGMTIAGAARSIGIDLDPKLDQKQAFEALSNEMALLAKQTAEGTNLMPGAMSEADRTFLTQLVPNLGKTKEANKSLIDFMIKAEKRSVELAKMAREYRKKNGSIEGFSEFAADYAEKNPLFSPAKQSTIGLPPQSAIQAEMARRGLK